MENKIRKSTLDKYKEWYIIWKRQKKQGKTMQQVADFISVKLTTFYRGIKKVEQLKKINNNQK